MKKSVFYVFDFDKAFFFLVCQSKRHLSKWPTFYQMGIVGDRNRVMMSYFYVCLQIKLFFFVLFW